MSGIGAVGAGNAGEVAAPAPEDLEAPPASGAAMASSSSAASGGGAPATAPLPDRMAVLAALGAQGPAEAAPAPALPETSLSLIPGRYPDDVDLPTVLSRMPETPEGRAAVGNIVGAFEARTGVTIPQEKIDAAAADPAKLIDALAVSPAEMSKGADAINAGAKAGLVKPLPAPVDHLPSGFDLAGLASAPVPLPSFPLKQVAPGLLQGDLPSGISDAQARSNIAMAEAFDRLAKNADAPDGQKFAVTLDGQSYTDLGSLLSGLQAQGYEVTAEVDHRIANFADLKTKDADGSVHDVPAALMVKTGFTGPDGREAVVPAVHSELVFHIKSGPDTQGPPIDADVKFFQGIDGTGFFPANLAQNPPWCGSSVTDRFEGADVVQAGKLAGLLGDVINDSAADQHLAMGGYGVTGVCNDSIAVLQQALAGRVTAYPLLERDETLAQELGKHIAAGGPDADAFRTLAASLAAVPNDMTPNASARERALASLPWAPGEEPFQSAVDARAILEGSAGA